MGDQSQYPENHASAWSAFYMTNHGCASFFDSFARGRYRPHLATLPFRAGQPVDLTFTSP